MATIKIWKTENEDRLLPEVCIVCGQKAQSLDTVKFSWYPSWVVLFLFFGLVPMIVMVWITRWNYTIDLPVCKEHAGYWKKRADRVSFLTFTGVCVFIVGILWGLTNQPGDSSTWLIILGSFVVILASVIAGVIIQSSGVKVKHIDEDTITLANAHDDFVNELEDDRERDEEQERIRREKRKAARRNPRDDE